MSQLKIRRFQRLHELLLLSLPISLLCGLLVTVVTPALGLWGTRVLLHPDVGQLTAWILTSCAFVVSKLSINKSSSDYPGAHSAWLIAPTVLCVYILLYVVTFFLRFDASRALLLSSGVLSVCWLHLEYFLTSRYRIVKLAVLPGGEADLLTGLPGLDARYISDFDLTGRRFDGVVADFSCLDANGERFLTRCALQRIAVYSARQVFESVTGRVRIDRMSENNIGSLLPSRQYEISKAVFDYTIVLLSAVVVVPVCLLTALAIRLESPGKAIYSQVRVGQGNRPFTIYKLRSMRFDRDACEQFAGEDDPRITRVGRIIRKLRIDELPQFYNVLRGDMSLIGPRPEQPSFVKEFDELIPFYSYRHVVKPGITGWAQVRHGYVSNAEDTRVKIQHDLYYIKNCSIMLDLYITFLTLKTMATGFGAR
ncbi:exopolysaccharide biosynthesis polyprenyl glycosylphosphotransferase [Alcaligenes aquatilis]|uniref:exopolysaccharide biosynthesis polyprenyl glycosylphosphotransferase n=1 Tax=Alcaligenes TaxID=507 RepID=UPI002226418E|nr:exopolysaccharide biosynthesis polyprenyl glycosylphosphotransferase [Alcaligenes sp. SMD-FA]UYY86914.1 exopolysaccharide biosynthesis polyprenyl glycosylphosphotransferase [Alcaligenes sp. SMD-FA]